MKDYGSKAGKEIVSMWVDPDVKKRIDALEDDSLIEQEIMKHLEACELDLKENVRCLDDEVLIFRGSMAAAKKAFKEAKQEQLNEMYELWESFDADIHKVRVKTTEAAAAIAPVREEIKALKNDMNSIRGAQYELENLLEVMQKIERCSDSTREMISLALRGNKNA